MLRAIATLTAALVLVMSSTAAAAPPYFLIPGTFPAETDQASATIHDGMLTLTKLAQTFEPFAAGATIDSAAGDTITTLGFDYRGYCQGGAPRFNVFTGTPGVDPYYFVACNLGTQTEGFVTFEATQGYNAFTGELTELSTIEDVSLVEIVQDEQGSVDLTNIKINGVTVTMATRPVPAAETPPGIVLTIDDTHCGQVSVTAHGFGLAPGASYQLVANQGTINVIADSTNTARASFTLAQSGEWGNAWIRTAAGGYLRTDFVWYHVRAC